MEQQQLENLLANVSSINKKYEEMARLTGENFNIFRILKIERSEVRMHSALLAELLNPNGSHGCGNIFLELFINHFLLCYKKQKKPLTAISGFFVRA